MFDLVAVLVVVGITADFIARRGADYFSTAAALITGAFSIAGASFACMTQILRIIQTLLIWLCAAARPHLQAACNTEFARRSRMQWLGSTLFNAVTHPAGTLSGI